MDIHQKVHELRTRIERLRAQLELNNTNTNDEPAQAVEPKQSAADAYKAKLMGKKPS